GLVGKRFEKADLLVRERANLRTTNQNSSNSIPFAQERRNNDCTCARNFVNSLGVRKFRVNFNGKIVNMNCFAIDNCPTDRSSMGKHSSAALPRTRHRTVSCHTLSELTVNTKYESVFGVAQPRRSFSNGI